MSVATVAASRGARLVCAAFCSAVLLAACSKQEAPPAPARPEVTVVSVAVKPMPLNLKYSARTRVEREVEVNARVSGILLKRF